MFRAGATRRFAHYGGYALATGINPIPSLSPIAYYKFNTGITVTGSGVSQWSDQSGNNNHLLQATDAARPPLQGDGTILFGGAGQFLRANAFTLVQPETVYMAFQQVTWTANNFLFDGNSISTGALTQRTATPQLNITAGTLTAPNTNLPVATYGVACAVFNGASSSLRINNTAKVTGNASIGQMGGFTLGASGASGQFGNIRVKEVAIYPVAHTDAQQDSVIAYLLTL